MRRRERQPDERHGCLADEGNAGGQQPECQHNDVARGGSRGGLAAAAGLGGCARPEQQRHHPFLRADRLRRLAVRRLDRGEEARASHVAERHRAEVERERLAARAFGRPHGRPPQRTDRGRVKPARERHHHASVALLDRQAGRLGQCASQVSNRWRSLARLSCQNPASTRTAALRFAGAVGESGASSAGRPSLAPFASPPSPNRPTRRASIAGVPAK